MATSERTLRILDPAECLDLLTAGGARDVFVRITPALISGRRVQPASAS
jgi:hypothetical protein